MQDELGLGFYDFGARNYDPTIGRWMNIDPLAEETLDAYGYCYQNPINFIDPDGQKGVRIIDKKNKTITIKAVYYVQTEKRITRTGKMNGYTSKQIARMEKRTNKWFNKQNLSVNKGEYEGYSIQFDLSFKEGGHFYEARANASIEQYEGYDIGNAIERGNKKTHPNLFKIKEYKDGKTEQAGGYTNEDKDYIIMNGEQDTEMNQIHEVGHTLGLEDNIKTGAKEGLMEYPPGKMTQDEANRLGNGNFLPAVIKIEE